MAKPKVKSELKALNIKIDKRIYDKLDKESLKTGVPKTTITEKAISEYIAKSRYRGKE